MERTVIKIDVTEEAEEYRREEPNLSTEENMVRTAIARGYKPYQMGRLLCIAKHRGETSEDVPAHKPAMFTGFATYYSGALAAMRELVKLGNGREVQIRSFLAPVPESEDEIESESAQAVMDLDVEEMSGAPTEEPSVPVAWNDERAVDVAKAYLLRKVPGYIIGRLNIIAANEGDVWAAWRELQGVVEERVKGLV